MRKELLKTRKQLNLTQKEIAQLIGVSQQHYCMIEKGKRNPHLSIMLKLESIFGIPKEILFMDIFVLQKTRQEVKRK